MDLFPIKDDELCGFINAKGQVVIYPKFYSVGNFSEGLAPARLEGLYGYIDQTGKYVIPAIYDFAMPFSGGLATVYLGEKLEIIDKKGVKQNYLYFEDFVKNVYSRVTTLSGKQGLINREGILIGDTIFKNIEPFSNGISIVTGLNDSLYGKDSTKIIKENGIIDSLGRWVLKYDEYEKKSDSVLNKLKKTDIIKTNKNLEIGNNNNWEAITEIDQDRAFVKLANNKWRLIDDTGKYIGNKLFDRIIEKNYNKFSRTRTNFFYSGIALVKYNNVYCSIDKAGNIIKSTNINSESWLRRFENRVYYTYGNLKNKNKIKYGLWNLENNKTVLPIFDDIDAKNLNKKLTRVIYNDKMAYINKDGTIIWQEQPRKKLYPINIDYKRKNLDSYNAYSFNKNEKDFNEYNSWMKKYNPNISKPLASKDRIVRNVLGLYVDQKQKVIWKNKFLGTKLIVSNTLMDTVFFDISGVSLFIKIQALDSNSVWRDLEVFQEANDYNPYTFLAPNYYWEIAIPKYEGIFKTKLRAILLYRKDDGKGKDKFGIDYDILELVSNEYEGSINPGQFWLESYQVETHNNNETYDNPYRYFKVF